MVLQTTEIPGRRLKILRVANPIFVSLFMQGTAQQYKVVSGGLPADAKIVNMKFGMGDYFDVLIESEQFEPVPLGQEIPEMEPPVITRI